MATRKTLKPIPARSRSQVAKAPAIRAKLVVALSPVADAAGEPVVKAKQKLVRDSFTMPKNEYVLIDTLKQRALGLGHPAKKSEILRAGVAVLSRMTDADLFASLGTVSSLKTGRPKDESKPADKELSKKKK